MHSYTKNIYLTDTAIWEFGKWSFPLAVLFLRNCPLSAHVEKAPSPATASSHQY